MAGSRGQLDSLCVFKHSGTRSVNWKGVGARLTNNINKRNIARYIIMVVEYTISVTVPDTWTIRNKKTHGLLLAALSEQNLSLPLNP